MTLSSGLFIFTPDQNKSHPINCKTNHTWSTVIQITLDQLQNRPTLRCVAHPDEVNGEVVVNLGAIYPSNDVVGCNSWVQVWVSGALPDPAWKPPGQAIQLDVRVSLQGKFTLWTVHEKWDGGLTVYASTLIIPTHIDRNGHWLAEHSASRNEMVVLLSMQVLPSYPLTLIVTAIGLQSTQHPEMRWWSYCLCKYLHHTHTHWS